MAIWIGKLVNALCRPLVKRIGAELLPRQEQQIAALRRSLEPAILPLVVKNEIEHMQQVPIAFLQERTELVFVGYGSAEMGKIFSQSRCLVPPIADQSLLSGNILFFLDEYHFLTLIRNLPTLFASVRQAIMLPLRGEYLDELDLRRTLHRLGFAEVCLLDYERISDTYAISGISHPLPVSAQPIMICPAADTPAATRWLVASRYPTQS